MRLRSADPNMALLRPPSPRSGVTLNRNLYIAATLALVILSPVCERLFVQLDCVRAKGLRMLMRAARYEFSLFLSDSINSNRALR